MNTPAENRCLLSLRVALFNWKWWRRYPAEVETALSEKEFGKVEEAFVKSAMDAMDECIERGVFVDQIKQLGGKRGWDFNDYYAMLTNDITLSAPDFKDAESWSGKEDVLQQIEDLMSSHRGLFDYLSTLHLADIGGYSNAVEAMRGLMNDALYHVETMRQDEEPHSRPK